MIPIGGKKAVRTDDTHRSDHGEDAKKGLISAGVRWEHA